MNFFFTLNILFQLKTELDVHWPILDEEAKAVFFEYKPTVAAVYCYCLSTCPQYTA